MSSVWKGRKMRRRSRQGGGPEAGMNIHPLEQNHDESWESEWRIQRKLDPENSRQHGEFEDLYLFSTSSWAITNTELSNLCWFLSTLLLISEPINIRMHYTTMILPKIETILGQSKHHRAYAWKLMFLKQRTCDKKTSYKYLFERRLALRGKQNIFALKLKLKAKCLFSLTAGLQLCAYCWLEPFLSKHPALQKTQPLCQDFCLPRAFVAMAISCSPGTKLAAPYHTYTNNVQIRTNFSLKHRVYPVTTVPIFTCYKVSIEPDSL